MSCFRKEHDSYRNFLVNGNGKQSTSGQGKTNDEQYGSKLEYHQHTTVTGAQFENRHFLMISTVYFTSLGFGSRLRFTVIGLVKARRRLAANLEGHL